MLLHVSNEAESGTATATASSSSSSSLQMQRHATDGAGAHAVVPASPAGAASHRHSHRHGQQQNTGLSHGHRHGRDRDPGQVSSGSSRSSRSRLQHLRMRLAIQSVGAARTIAEPVTGPSFRRAALAGGGPLGARGVGMESDEDEDLGESDSSSGSSCLRRHEDDPEYQSEAPRRVPAAEDRNSLPAAAPVARSRIDSRSQVASDASPSPALAADTGSDLSALRANASVQGARIGSVGAAHNSRQRDEQ